MQQLKKEKQIMAPRFNKDAIPRYFMNGNDYRNFVCRICKNKLKVKRLKKLHEESANNPTENIEFRKQTVKIEENRKNWNSVFNPKIRLKFDDVGFKSEQSLNEDKSGNSTGGEDIHEYQLEETTEIEHDNDDMQDFETIEEEVSSNEREENYDYKISNNSANRNSVYRNTSTKKDVSPNNASSRKSYFTCIAKSNMNQSTAQLQDVIHIEENQPAVNSVIEMPNSSSREHNSLTTVLPVRDQWDIFGEMIANEFRLLNSEKSRKKLKRKIMHDLLVIGEEDDNCK